MSLASVLVLVFATIYAAEARPEGAPAAACSTLTPSSLHGNTPQMGEIPYEIDLSVFDIVNMSYVYNPGRTYTVTLRRTMNSGVTFRGFLVQTRMVADDTVVGTFATNGAANMRLSSCTPANSGVTHVNTQMPRVEFQMVQFQWTAPAVGTGDIWFRFAVVQELTIYWADQRSSALEEGTPFVAPTPTPSPTPTAPSGAPGLTSASGTPTPTTPTPTTPAPTTPAPTTPSGTPGLAAFSVLSLLLSLLPLLQL